MLIEAPTHASSYATRNGQLYIPTADEILDGQLVAHLEIMGFLADTGGRARWTAKPAKRAGL